MRDRLARFLRASVAGWRYALTHQQEAVGIVLRANRSAGGLDVSHQRRMLQEVAKLMPGNRHGIGYLEPAAYERTVDVLLPGGAEPVIRRRPEGAWIHLIGPD